jgi:pimeloyl-ACP methyl ester carboxylesterase
MSIVESTIPPKSRRFAAVREVDFPVTTSSIWFGTSGRPLAGWAHLPAGDRMYDCGVVLCNPFGVEMMATRRAYRHLADRLARRGVPVLRFDFDGTGDSAGTDHDPARLERWMESIDHAVHQLDRLCGVKRVAVVGVRLGALLARAYAATHPLHGLVLVACPPTGKAHVRELRAFEAMRAGGEEAATDAYGEYLAGFYLASETAQALAGIDAASLGLATPCDVMLASSDHIGPGEARIMKGLVAAGGQVTLTKTPGYAAMMNEDPYSSVAPDALWSEIGSWIAARSSMVDRSPPEPTSMSTVAHIRTDAGRTIREELVGFDGMVGVLGEPETPAEPGRPTLILLNIGANHRVGNGRIYVTLARDFAARGFRVLRFDRTGIGDSPARPGAQDNIIYSSQGTADTQSAMNYIEKIRGERSFVLMGICSGAYFAYYTAAVDPRVTGLVMINILTFQRRASDAVAFGTRGQFKATRFYLNGMFDPKTLLRAVRGKIQIGSIAHQLAERAVSLGMTAAYSLTGRDEILETFRKFATRKADVLLVFSENDAGIDLIEQHLGLHARKVRGPHFKMTRLHGADHTFTGAPSQRALQEALVRHLATIASGSNGK